ncbi:precorrin-6A/cobalt-precorrin-6A reductase [Zhongshania antarctica]|uniref:Precorrin-6A/cobalt-precorrin-6A reductase n=1 Tax=Zhongshania antarctica TaxID=641702 RepID=A0A840R2Z9_9GAMM|nr:precorrin-6A/cobalt-precorrin-6A reductase [Zhongshania antarctica]MBB5186924.1 precorrin-6A/cobalt-precorrin-6A reductase [Zhongshania antarctica]
MTILILGGTSEAKAICQQLANIGRPLIYSIAGMVRQPVLSCEVISGGFSQYGGLAAWCRRRGVQGIVDATHPFASRISASVSAVSIELGIPCWRFTRPLWQAGPNDNWHEFNHLAELSSFFKASAQASPQRIFMSVGKLDSRELALFKDHQLLLVRSAIPLQCTLPSSGVWVQAVGPFAVAGELELLRNYAIDAIVCKNSGGEAVAAKLDAARQLSLPVYMQRRHVLAQGDGRWCTEFSTAQALVYAVTQKYLTSSLNE